MNHLRQKNMNTLRSLLNEVALLTIVTIVKRASLFNRDLRVLRQQAQRAYCSNMYTVAKEQYHICTVK